MSQKLAAKTLEFFDTYLEKAGVHYSHSNVPRETVINCLFKTGEHILIGLQNVKLSGYVPNIRVCGWRIEFEVDEHRLMANPFDFNHVRKFSDNPRTLLPFLDKLVETQPNFSCYEFDLQGYEPAGPVVPFGSANGWIVLLKKELGTPEENS